MVADRGRAEKRPEPESPGPVRRAGAPVGYPGPVVLVLVARPVLLPGGFHVLLDLFYLP